MDGSGSSSKRLIVALACGMLRTAAAKATFSDSTGAAIGTETRASHATTSSLRPAPRFPSPARSCRPNRSHRVRRRRVARPDRPDTAGSKTGQGRGGVHSRDDGKPQRAPHAAAHRFPRERVRRRAAHECAGDAAGFRDPEDRADVAWLLNIDDDKHESEVAAAQIPGSLAGRATIAAMPDGVFTGLNASNTSSDVSITSRPHARASLQDGSRHRRAGSTRRPRRPRTTDRMHVHPARRWAPSSSTCVPLWLRASAAARNRDTSGFCRLVMIFTCGVFGVQALDSNSTV